MSKEEKITDPQERITTARGIKPLKITMLMLLEMYPALPSLSSRIDQAAHELYLLKQLSNP